VLSNALLTTIFFIIDFGANLNYKLIYFEKIWLSCLRSQKLIYKLHLKKKNYLD